MNTNRRKEREITRRQKGGEGSEEEKEERED